MKNLLGHRYAHPNQHRMNNDMGAFRRSTVSKVIVDHFGFRHST